MTDFLLSPIKAIYNLDTYIKATKQSFGRILLFLIYLIVFTSIVFFVGILVRTPSLDPLLDETITQIAEVTPVIEIKDGTIKANDGEYIEVQLDPEMPKVVFETNRTEPVYPTQMEKNNTAIFVTGEKIHIFSGGGNVKTVPVNNKINQTITKEYILENKADMIETIKTFLFWGFLFSMPFVIIFFSIVLFVLAFAAAAISQMFIRTESSFWDIVRICCYMIAPALLFIFIVIMIPLNIPLIWLICFVIFMTYSNLIFTKIKLLDTKKSRTEKKKEIEEKTEEDDED
jgi:Protein of unknown function (DUF1189).